MSPAQLSAIRTSLANRTRQWGTTQFYVYSYDIDDEGAELGVVWAADSDDAMEAAIEAWSDVGGDYCEGLVVRHCDPFYPESQS